MPPASPLTKELSHHSVSWSVPSSVSSATITAAIATTVTLTATNNAPQPQRHSKHNMMPSPILRSDPAEHVRVLAINRPKKYNALSQEAINLLLQELQDASDDDNVRAIVVTGTDELFCGIPRTLTLCSPLMDGKTRGPKMGVLVVPSR